MCKYVFKDAYANNMLTVDPIWQDVIMNPECDIAINNYFKEDGKGGF